MEKRHKKDGQEGLVIEGLNVFAQKKTLSRGRFALGVWWFRKRRLLTYNKGRKQEYFKWREENV